MSRERPRRRLAQSPHGAPLSTSTALQPTTTLCAYLPVPFPPPPSHHRSSTLSFSTVAPHPVPAPHDHPSCNNVTCWSPLNPPVSPLCTLRRFCHPPAAVGSPAGPLSIYLVLPMVPHTTNFTNTLSFKPEIRCNNSIPLALWTIPPDH